MSLHVLKLDLYSARWMPKLDYRRSELPGLDVTISARYHWSVARQLTPISGILPYNRNVTLQTLELFSAYARLYNAAASPASRLHSAGSLVKRGFLLASFAAARAARVEVPVGVHMNVVPRSTMNTNGETEN